MVRLVVAFACIAAVHGALDHFPSSEAVWDELNLIARSSPEAVNVTTIGTSHLGKSIGALQIGLCDGNVPTVLVTALLHAREPVGMLAALHAARVVANATRAPEDPLHMLAASRCWVFVPVANPDGWDAVKQGVTMKRKNAEPTCAGAAPADERAGVDLNRNFPVCFDAPGGGSSDAPCAEDFRGASPLSAPESRALAAFAQRLRPALRAAVSLHAFGRMLVSPYACESLGDAVTGTAMEAVVANMADVSGFSAGPPWKQDALYSVNGDFGDFLFNRHSVFTVSPELSPGSGESDENGFLPPPAVADPAARQALHVILSMGRAAGCWLNVTLNPRTLEGAATSVGRADCGNVSITFTASAATPATAPVCAQGDSVAGFGAYATGLASADLAAREGRATAPVAERGAQFNVCAAGSPHDRRTRCWTSRRVPVGQHLDLPPATARSGVLVVCADFCEALTVRDGRMLARAALPRAHEPFWRDPAGGDLRCARLLPRGSGSPQPMLKIAGVVALVLGAFALSLALAHVWAGVRRRRREEYARLRPRAGTEDEAGGKAGRGSAGSEADAGEAQGSAGSADVDVEMVVVDGPDRAESGSRGRRHDGPVHVIGTDSEDEEAGDSAGEDDAGDFAQTTVSVPRRDERASR